VKNIKGGQIPADHVPRSGMPSLQASWWILTVPQHLFLPYLPRGVLFIRGQLETGSKTGYLHWQICIRLAQKGTLRTVNSMFGDSVHAEPTRSSAAIEYCWKEDTRIAGTQFELGQIPHRRNDSSSWQEIWELAKKGQIEKVDPNVRVVHYRTLRSIAADFAEPIGMERTCNVFWGRTGSGKSRRAWEEAGENAYAKDPQTKFWCGYRGQSNVVIDEFRGAIGIAHLLRWLDRYPVCVEIKGSSMPLQASQLWITSNIHPQSWYPDLDGETFLALERRLIITEFE